MKFFKFLFLLIIINCNGQSENNKQKEPIKKEITKNDIYYANCTSNVLSTGHKIRKEDNWSLNIKEVEEILKLSTEIDENEWHFSYPITPCNIEIKKHLYKGKKYDLQINGGSYLSLFDGKKTKILGCDSPDCKKYFLEAKESMDDEIDTPDINKNTLTTQNKIYHIDFNKNNIQDLLTVKKNNVFYLLEVKVDNKILLKKELECDFVDIETKTKYNQAFNLILRYNDQYQKTFRKIVIPILYKNNNLYIEKLFKSNLVTSAKSGNEEWFNKEIKYKSSLEQLDLEKVISD